MTCRYMNSNIKCSSEAAESVLNECTVEQIVHMEKCLSGTVLLKTMLPFSSKNQRFI